MAKGCTMTDSEIMIGTVVGESTTHEFRFAVSPDQACVQDLVAVDAELQETGAQRKEIRIWAKVSAIERINPLFPLESGQELADLQINPFDTVVSMSREMITALCSIIGYEIKGSKESIGLKKLRYPPRPASAVYRPTSVDTERILTGDLGAKSYRELDIAELATRNDVNINIDGEAIVSRHLAILAMTGAGKSWTARKIVEQLAERQYPIVIFDPHGEYGVLSGNEQLKDRIKQYRASVQILEEDLQQIIRLINSFSSELTPNMEDKLGPLFRFAKRVLKDTGTRRELEEWLLNIYENANLSKWHLTADLFGVAYISEYVEHCVIQNLQDELAHFVELGYQEVAQMQRRDATQFLDGIKRRLFRTAFSLREMEKRNRLLSKGIDLPTDASKLISKGQISVIGLGGYTPDIQAGIYSLVADKLFNGKVEDSIKLPFVIILEEAHRFAPNRSEEDSQNQSMQLTRQIAQEGRKFGVGLILISQRPSRLDETALSQCNSFVIMRLINPADQKFVRTVIETVGEEEAKLLPDLDIGEALICGQCVQFPILVKIKSPDSRGEKQEKDLIQLVAEAR